MRNPFRRPDHPRLIKRTENLELRCTDLEDSIEKVLYQQTRLLGKINARHKKQLQEAEAALDPPDELTPPQGDLNGLTAFSGLPNRDLKAHLRAQAAQLRRR